MENNKKGKKSILYYIVIALFLLLSGGLGANQLDGGQENTAVESQINVENTEGQTESEEITDSQENVDSQYTEKNVENTNTDKQENNETVEENSKQEDNQITETEEFVATEYTFRNEGTFQSHYEKHGIEMGFESPEDYLDAANKVVANPESLHKLEKEDGDDVYYLEETNEFVVVSKDGYIRTYFLPSAGINYYNRQ